MKIFITGISGFVGRHLARALLAAGHRVAGTGRRPLNSLEHPHLDYLSADTTRSGDWQKAVSQADVVINLAGATIARRWTASYKKTLYTSRIETTRHLASAMRGRGGQTLLSASAIGYYGNAGDTELTETAPAGSDFLARLSVDWEEAARTAAAGQDTRVCLMRFGVVLGSDGGALAQMLPAFRRGLGGSLGTGRQWFSWIHIKDLIDAILFLIDEAEIEGPVNLTAPEPVRQRDMARTLGRHLGRPALLPAPASMLRLVLGELTDSLLASQRVVPQRLLEAGFVHRWPTIDGALEELGI
jgi:uncharacterized protein (TIGR01777 family)